MPARLSICIAAAATLALVACSSHGGFVPSSAGPASASQFRDDASSGNATMTFTVKIPKAPRAETPAQRHERFVSASTQSIQFAVYKAHSPHTKANLLATQVYNLSRGAKGCTGPGGGPRTCTETIALPPPAVDLVVATFDKPPKGTKIPPTAKQLAADSIVDQSVKAGGKLKFTLGGIPVSVVMTLPGATVVKGLQTTSMHGVAQLDQRISLQALDADGNVIVTDTYVGRTGAAANVSMTVTASQKTCGSGTLQDGELAPGATIHVGAPPSDGITFDYGQNAIATPFTTAGACTFAVKAAIANSTQRGAFVLTGPQITLYPVQVGTGGGLTVGPDQNIWFATGASTIATMNVQTKAVTTYPLGSGSIGVTAGTDGNLWIAEYGKIESMTPSGTIVNSFPFTNPKISSQTSQQIAEDALGNFWTTFPEGQNVMSMSSTGTASFYTPAAPNPSPYPGGITKGPDGNMWFSDCAPLPGSSGKIERISPTGTSQKAFVIPPSSSGAIYPTFITSGSDGNLWFTSCPARSISRMTISGTFTTFEAPLVNNSVVQSYGLANGPDHAMWFGNVNSTNGSLQRIPLDATSASQITSFVLPNHAGVYWVVAGPDGAIWFTESLYNSGQFVSSGIGRMTL